MVRRTGVARIVIVDDHALFAEALDLTLSMAGHQVHMLPIAGHSASSARVLSACRRLEPGIVILDLDLGEANGTTIIEPLVRTGAAVVVVTGSADRARWGECLSRGASAVLSKCASLDTILAVIEMTDSGVAAISDDERDRLIACYEAENDYARDIRRRLESLSARERQVLGGLARGRTPAEIAQTSFVSEATVRTQIRSILTKLEVSSQIAAVGAAFQAHWRPPGAA